MQAGWEQQDEEGLGGYALLLPPLLPQLLIYYESSACNGSLAPNAPWLLRRRSWFVDSQNHRPLHHLRELSHSASKASKNAWSQAALSLPAVK